MSKSSTTCEAVLCAIIFVGWFSVANFSMIHYNRPVSFHGGHGEKVITGVCGTSITGSIPVDRPTKKLSVFRGFFCGNVFLFSQNH